MFYPNSFKEKVIQQFSDNTPMKNSLKLGDVTVGRILKSEASRSFTADDILFASASHDFDSLVWRAKKQKEYQSLYEEWEGLYKEWYQYCTDHNLPVEEL